MSEQKISLQVGDTSDQPNNTMLGEQLLSNDLIELGLDGHESHFKIGFDNTQTVKYIVCNNCVPCLLPCLCYGTFQWAKSRKAAVTSHKIVYKQGYYYCYCCCWNEGIKSVPLDKITDLQTQQTCCQKCFNIKELRVETASANQAFPEISLIGVLQADQVRKQVFAVKEQHGYDPSQSGYIAPMNRNNNPVGGVNSSLLQDDTSKQAIIAIEKQQQVMIDLLKDMKDALVSMNNKMDNNNVSNINNNESNNNDE